MLPLQLPLDLKLPPPLFTSQGFEVSSSNEEAFLWVERWPHWPTRTLSIYGPSGCGKTHLAHLWCQKTEGIYLRGKDIKADTTPPTSSLVIDDTDHCCDEEALLHLYNRVQQNQHFLFLLSKTPPASWSVSLLDLKSRLHTIPAFGIHEPEDTLLKKLLEKLFKDAQLKVSPEVIEYLLKHMERSYQGTLHLVQILNQKALVHRRNITLPFLKEVLLIT